MNKKRLLAKNILELALSHTKKAEVRIYCTKKCNRPTYIPGFEKTSKSPEIPRLLRYVRGKMYGTVQQ